MRVFLITGASSGIGAAVARAVAAPDTSIVVHARKNRSGAERVAQAAGAAGAQSLVVEGDLGQAGTATRLVEETAQRFGRLDVVVSNAGFADRRLIGEVDRVAWDASLAAMTSAFFELATAAKPWLVKAGAGGRMIGVSVFVAHAFSRGIIGFSASPPPEAGMGGLAKALPPDLAPPGRQGYWLAPGF